MLRALRRRAHGGLRDPQVGRGQRSGVHGRGRPGGRPGTGYLWTGVCRTCQPLPPDMTLSSPLLRSDVGHPDTPRTGIERKTRGFDSARRSPKAHSAVSQRGARSRHCRCCDRRGVPGARSRNRVAATGPGAAACTDAPRGRCRPLPGRPHRHQPVVSHPAHRRRGQPRHRPGRQSQTLDNEWSTASRRRSRRAARFPRSWRPIRRAGSRRSPRSAPRAATRM
jgi:hypothetical protein